MSTMLKNVRWVRNNREMARVLGISLPRQRNKLKAKLSEINGWRAETDFPPLVKGKGFPALEVIAWAQRYAARVAQDKVKIAAAAEVLGSDKPRRAAIKELQRPSFAAAEVLLQGNEAEDFRPVESIRQLAPRLSAYFKLHLTEQRLKQWLNGQLPPGAAPFPLRDPGRNGWSNPQPCFEWVERYYAQPRANNGGIGQEDLFAKTVDEARMAELTHTIDDARKARMEADAKERELSEKWISRAAALGTATRALNDVLHIVEGEYERNAPQRRREKLQGMLVVPVESRELKVESILQDFAAWDAAEERFRIDRIRAACAALAVG